MAKLAAGTSVGPYRILSLLGEGGMGVVYTALDTKLNRRVALKFLSADVATVAERRRFQREAQTASSLNHPHIIAVHDVGEFDGRQYLVTELADGGTLREWALAAPRPWREVVELLVGVADALATAHEAGILHRDVKPDNVLLTKSGYAKLADFGLARIQAEPRAITRTNVTGATQPGVILGTTAYLSPEQVAGGPADARSDVFAFGVLLYEMLSGQRPFGGASQVDVLHAIAHATPAPLPSSIPAALRGAVEKALEKHPADRYQSMRELIVDMRRALRQSDAVAVPPAAPRRRGVPWAIVTAVVLAGAAAAWFYERATPHGTASARVEYTALTNFADSAVAPAISPDGRMLAFIRGDSTFVGPGEIYVKLLPDGEPTALTHDGLDKTGPLVFTPDGSRIGYTVNTIEAWTVPVLGGEPARILSNAASLSWLNTATGTPGRVLFAALTGEGIHMGLFTATESRADERTMYVPRDINGMVHRARASPDGRWAVIVEMDMLGWRPCRVVPLDGQSAAQAAGPAPSQCTDAAWSPDGQWIYVAANTGNGFHIWRQRFPGGAPEQVTATATEEQGIAVAPDGRSFVTSVGERQSTLWVHRESSRQVTFEGFAYLPSFSDDGRRLYYLQRSRADRRFVSGELWTMDLERGTRERLLPDRLMEHYEISRDGTRVVFVSVDDSGRSSVWEALLDGRLPPRQLSSFEAIRVLYGPAGDVYFVGGETTSLYLYHLSIEGSAPRKVMDVPANFAYDVSPDGKWVAAWVGSAVAFYPVNGGTPIQVCAYCGTAGEENRGVTPPLIQWSHDGRYLYLHDAHSRHTFVVRLRPGEVLPRVPAGGVDDIASLARLLGGRAVDDERAFMGQEPSLYAFPRVATHRNIYRVTVP